MMLSYEVMAVLISFLVGYYLINIWSRFAAPNNNEPPKAGGARPLVGHLHLIGGRLAHITFAAMADKYGPIFTVQLGVHRALIVSKWELVKEIFTTCDTKVSFRPNLVSGKLLGFDSTMFSFSNDLGYWRGIRKLISQELLSAPRLELLKHVRVWETAESVNQLYKAWEVLKIKDGSDSGRMMMQVELKQWLGDLNLKVMLRIVADKKLSHGGDDSESSRCRAVLGEFFLLIGQFLVGDMLPYLGWLDVGGFEKRMKKTARELDIIVGKWLEEHRADVRSGGGGGEDKLDFMGVMLSTIHGVSLGGHDPDTVIKTTCLAMVAGGTDSITIGLVWALSLLLNNPNALKRAYEELDTVVGRDRRLNDSDIQNLVYLQAIVKETLRLYPALPLPGREFTQDCTVGGYHVPKGTRLIVNLWKLHRDPSVWAEEPSSFMPERFLSRSSSSDDALRQHFEYIPFGAGRRMCPAMNFGVQMMHLVLAYFLHSFDVKTPDDHQVVDMTESSGLTNMKATPLRVLVAPRLSPNHYID
ncbi:cytochrome P450 CYP82D47-like [Henckelia pumila]|uniref:cytochrome P450 CYP82D47-like n=1 Tax=Henckelia pumila TaxID=405737 RepID=UPI003C6DF6F2